MKYFTKQWYEDIQKAHMYYSLKVSKKAENFSEEYYKELYKKEENKWLRLQKEMFKVKFEDIYPEYANINILNKEECEERERLLEDFYKTNSFDLEKAKQQFNELHKWNIENLKYKLPSEILNNVADIRVLALERASEYVKKLIIDYCKDKNVMIEKARKDYEEYYNKELKARKDNIVEELYLHDCLITNIIKEKDKLTIEIDSSAGFTDIKAVIFEDYEIIEEDMNFINGWWLYEEVYIENNIYEIHALIDVPIKNKCCINVGNLTVKAKKVELI